MNPGDEILTVVLGKRQAAVPGAEFPKGMLGPTSHRQNVSEPEQAVCHSPKAYVVYLGNSEKKLPWPLINFANPFQNQESILFK
jgi:hypothetical protein